MVDLFVKEGLVISTEPNKNKSENFLDEEWNKTLLNLMNNRHRISSEDEEKIKSISNKL
jgi:hypothetical protein